MIHLEIISWEVLDEAGNRHFNIARDKEGETALAFVSLASDGNRDFKFIEKQCRFTLQCRRYPDRYLKRLWNDSFLQRRPCGISNEGSSQEN